MRFAKYQGIGNDFIMIGDADDSVELAARDVVRLCDRRFGIGADGVIRVAPGRDGADFFMDYVNSDGSSGEMCGNGIRCLAIFAKDEGLTDKEELLVDTRAGRKLVTVDGDDVTVNMGPPVFPPEEIPVSWDGDDALQAKIEVDDAMLEVTCLSMGNPHAILFVDDPETAPVATLGPVIERHSSFPNKTNVEFVRIDSPTTISMRVWERGAGETQACGTGACAAAVAGRLLGGMAEELVASLPGGELVIAWPGSRRDPQPVMMTGPAVKSFEGAIDWPFAA